MPVLRASGRKKAQCSQALEGEQAHQAEQASGRGNEWEGQSTTQTTEPVRRTGPLTVESEWIGARRYLANLPYTLPKDAPEADRQDFQHYYFRRLFRGLYLAPLERRRLGAVLDVGCGTGRWACEMALAFPQVRIVGLDIEQPGTGTFVPPSNFVFRSGNVLQRLPFADRSFDFVHQRLLVAAIPTARWPAVVAELARVTAWGGWIELIETNDTYLNAGPALAQFLYWSRIVSVARGIEAGRVAYLDDLLLGAGLWRVEKRVTRVPVGSWGGRLGHTLAQSTLAAFAGLRGLLCQRIPLRPEQFDATLALIADEWNAYRTECAIYAAYGQMREET